MGVTNFLTTFLGLRNFLTNIMGQMRRKKLRKGGKRRQIRNFKTISIT